MYSFYNARTLFILKDGGMPVYENTPEYEEYLQWLAAGNKTRPCTPVSDEFKSDCDRAVALLLKLSTPTESKDVELKSDLLNRFGEKA